MKSRLEVVAEGILGEFSRRHARLRWKTQYRFHPERRWRADFLVGLAGDSVLEVPGNGVLIEVEGIVWGDRKGRHQTASGFEGDAIKYNAAALMGWHVLRYTRGMMISGEMDRDLKEFFGVGQ